MNAFIDMSGANLYKGIVEALELTEHPTLYKPTELEIVEWAEEHGEEKVAEMLLEREELIKLEKEDPFNYRQVLPHWDDAKKLLDEKDQILISGGTEAARLLFVLVRNQVNG